MGRHSHRSHHRSRLWAPLGPKLSTPTIDTHTHIQDTVEFSHEMARQAAERHEPVMPVYSVDDLLRFARHEGITQIVDVGCEYPDWPTALRLTKSHPGVIHAGLAVHPVEAVMHGHRAAIGPDGLKPDYKPWHDISYADAFAHMADLARAGVRDGSVVLIGETGLDYYREGPAARPLEIAAFRDHIRLAKELNVPVQIHDRQADRDCVDTLLRDGSPSAGVIFHSFAGDGPMARIAREHGWYLSFSGTVTFAGNEHIRDGLRTIDRDHILVETDAPYLTPIPWRGRTNSSYMIPYTIAVMARVLNMSADEVAHITQRNALRLLGLSELR
jgi:TatD DNase family protein